MKLNPKLEEELRAIIVEQVQRGVDEAFEAIENLGYKVFVEKIEE